MGSASGARVGFVQFSDPSGIIEVALFEEVLSASRELLESGAPLVISAEARRDGETLRASARRVRPLDRARGGNGLTIHLAEPSALEGLRAALDQADRGSGRVTLVIELADREVDMALPGGYAVTPSVRGAIQALPGVSAVE